MNFKKVMLGVAAAVVLIAGWKILTRIDHSNPIAVGNAFTKAIKAMTNVRFERIGKSFGKTVALDDINLEIKPGELFFLLGPSGCGKSTLLRILAGLLAPTRGRVLFNDRDVTSLATEKRNAVMVFQSYALWPHMTVAENVAFGLEVRGKSNAQRNQRVAEVLKLVRLGELAERKPNQLSGGQQQRVALARALAVSPAVLLLDEPLSNLDAKLRGEMRSEIRRICKQAGTELTTVYVTHDQKEALSIADRVALMDRGKIIQVGTPQELYRRPVNRFVAEFIGQTNLLGARVLEQQRGLVRMQTALGTVMAFCDTPLAKEVTISIRPEQMRIVRADGLRVQQEDDVVHGRNRFIAEAVENSFLGDVSEHVVSVEGTKLTVLTTPPMFDVPDELLVEFDPEDVVVLGD